MILDVGLARVNGDDKLVRGLSDAMVESTVNILISDVVVTEGNSGVVVTATVGVISSSKLLSVIRFITLSVDWLVMDTTSDVVITLSEELVTAIVPDGVVTEYIINVVSTVTKNKKRSQSSMHYSQLYTWHRCECRHIRQNTSAGVTIVLTNIIKDIKTITNIHTYNRQG